MSDADPIFSSHDVHEASGALLFSFDKERIVSRVRIGRFLPAPARYARGVDRACASLSLSSAVRPRTHIYASIFLRTLYTHLCTI